MLGCSELTLGRPTQITLKGEMLVGANFMPRKVFGDD